jgi:hypothetical protein
MTRPRALGKPPAPNDQKPHPLLKESHVEQTVTQFLELDGWRSFKMEANSERGFVQRVMAQAAKSPLFQGCLGPLKTLLQRCMRAQGVGEPGMPDRLFLRYEEFNLIPPSEEPPRDWTLDAVTSLSQVLWIEFKKPGERPRPDQTAWHEAERARGALVLVVSDIDDFRLNWYPKSGLQRRSVVR